MKFSFATLLTLCYLASVVSAVTTVLANFQMINAESYDVDTWKTDIVAAKNTGIDGFSLELVPTACNGNMSWQLDQLTYARAAAETEHFQLMLSFDMSYYFHTTNCPDNNPWTVLLMAAIIQEHNSYSCSIRWNDKVLIGTYEGGLYGTDFFNKLDAGLAGSHIFPIIAPYMSHYAIAASKSKNPESSAERIFTDYGKPSVAGFFNRLAWPNNVRQNLTTTVDNAFMLAVKNAGRSGPFIMAISPWQFEDLNIPNPSGSWVQYSDTLFYYRWYEATNDVKPDIVTLLTWNNYADSSYLREVPAKTGPGSVELGEQGNYVYGMNHTAWGTLVEYYAAYLKNGTLPKITNNDLVYWYRLHPKNVKCAGGTRSASTPVRNSDFPSDSVFIWANIRAHVTVEVYFGTSPSTRSPRPGTPKVTFNTAGQTSPMLFELPFPADFPRNSTDKLYPQVVVNPGRIAYSKYDSVPITAECAWENYNAVVQSLGSDFNDIIG